MDLNNEIFKDKKIAIVTNRAPVSPVVKKDSTTIQRSIGGLVAALEPLVGNFDGKWICTVSKSSKLAKSSLSELPYEVCALELTDAEESRYYEGFSNKQLWPIFHYFQNNCVFNPEDYEVYKAVNEKMADFILENVNEEYFIWIHDYHFILLPEILRRKNPKLKIGFFLHTPFPNQELFRLLSDRKELLEGFLGADLIGFHTKQYVDHFVECVKLLLPQDDRKIFDTTIEYKNRKILVKDFPISIDSQNILNLCLTEKHINKVKKLKAAYNSEIIGLSIERLDYSKGIPERLKAIEMFFEKYPEYQQRVTFIQISVPSRTKVEAYQNLKREIDETIGRINGNLSREGWKPIFYIYNSLPFEELIAHYTMSDFCLVVPLRDGMNLVAKEYVASNVTSKGVLILSEFTGASDELEEALLVNPYQIKNIAEAIKTAIEMTEEEKMLRMNKLRDKVLKYDVFNWINNYFQSFDEAVKSNKSNKKLTKINS